MPYNHSDQPNEKPRSGPDIPIPPFGREASKDGSHTRKDRSGGMETSSPWQFPQESTEGEQVVGKATVLSALAGFLLGNAMGWPLGIALGYGSISIPGLAPLVAGGAGVPGFLFGTFLGALFALIGGVLGTEWETKSGMSGQTGFTAFNAGGRTVSAPEHPTGKARRAGPHAMGRPGASFIMRLPIYGSVGTPYGLYALCHCL